jgi:hypothetical protein
MKHYLVTEVIKQASDDDDGIEDGIPKGDQVPASGPTT